MHAEKGPRQGVLNRTKPLNIEIIEFPIRISLFSFYYKKPLKFC